MATEDEATVGIKRGRDEAAADGADHGDDGEEEEPAAKEARVEDGAQPPGGEGVGDATADTVAEVDAGVETAADDGAEAEEGADVASAEEPETEPSAVDQLAEALEMLAPVVTKRLDLLHASGLVLEEEIDAASLLLLGEFTPKVAVEIIDTMTKDNLEVSPTPRLPLRSGAFSFSIDTHTDLSFLPPRKKKNTLFFSSPRGPTLVS